MIDVQHQGETLILQMPKRVDSNLARAVDNELRQMVNKAGPIVIDLQNSLYLDSSGLGLLLHLREVAGGDKARITLKNLNSHVANIVRVSGFNRLFPVC